jgi:hypothetical protein
MHALGVEVEAAGAAVVGERPPTVERRMAQIAALTPHPRCCQMLACRCGS